MADMNKIAEENREHVMKLVDYRTLEAAHRDKLDLKKSADLVTAYSRVFAEDPGLYDLYRRVTSVSVSVEKVNDEREVKSTDAEKISADYYEAAAKAQGKTLEQFFKEHPDEYRRYSEISTVKI